MRNFIVKVQRYPLVWYTAGVIDALLVGGLIWLLVEVL